MTGPSDGALTPEAAEGPVPEDVASGPEAAEAADDTDGAEAPEGASDVPSRTPFGVMVAAVVVATAIVALGLSLRTDQLPATAPIEPPDRAVPEQGADADYDLAVAIPPEAEVVAGGWDVGEGGAVITEAAALPANPLLVVPLGGPPWATIEVEGQLVDGWAVAFALEGPGTYWTASVLPGDRTVQLIRVESGQPASTVTRPIGGEPTANVRIVWRGRQVQVEASGVFLPTVTVRPGDSPSFGLLGRGPAATPGAARWSSITVTADPPLPAAHLPPFLDARHTSADEVRTALGG